MESPEGHGQTIRVLSLLSDSPWIGLTVSQSHYQMMSMNAFYDNISASAIF